MQLSLFNTLTKQKEAFAPIDKNLVKMYVCGPTVYDRPHIGNARSIVVYDILYRILIELFGKEKVRYIRNITDIDDKIIDRAKNEGISINELTEKTIKYFHEDMSYLSCLTPTFEPKATEHINDMIEIINILLSNGFAYKAANHVYFDVLKYDDYTKLSGQSFDELLNAVRKDNSDGKRHHGDFVLWKPSKKDEDPFVIFQSPFGPGRPGWHIECSAMSHKFLGETFDIHGGGVDLVFPHHTNEIAQSCAAFKGSSYAKIWVHNGFLTVNHDKMSKSLGNFLTVQDLINKQINGDVIRLFLISAHYRKPMDYNEKAIKDTYNMITYWYRAIENIDPIKDINLPLEFLEPLLDDMNTYASIKVINDYAKIVHSSNDKTIKINNSSKLLKCANFLGLMNISSQEWFYKNVDETKIEQLIQLRKKEKLAKNWPRADAIRLELSNMGILIEDKPDGTTLWRRDNFIQ